jgi:hypothetical protein
VDHQAFAQLLGNYGEFFGAIAVVATLFYLAVQIKQNTRQLRRAETNSTLEQANNIRGLRVDGELAKVLAKIVDAPEDTLTTEEKIRLNSYYAMEMWHHFNRWDRMRAGILDTESHAFDAVTRSLLEHETGLRWWSQNEMFFDRTFAESVNKVRASTGSG